MVILTMFMVLLLLLSINVPIAIGLAVTTIIAMVMKTGTSFLIDTAIVMFDGSMTVSYTHLTLPTTPYV